MPQCHNLYACYANTDSYLCLTVNNIIFISFANFILCELNTLAGLLDTVHIYDSD